MPMYTWLDETSGKRVDIIRKFDQSDEAPTRDDISETEMSDEQLAAAKWTKIIAATGFVRMPGWGYGSKGNW